MGELNSTLAGVTPNGVVLDGVDVINDVGANGVIHYQDVNGSFNIYGENDNFTYADYPFDHELHGDMGDLNKLNITAFAIILAWTFTVNVIVIAACLSNKTSRKDVFYSQIINFSISNIVISCLVLPLTIYALLYGWDLGQTLCKIWIIADIMLPFVGLIIIIVLSIDRLVFFTHPKVYSWLFQKFLRKVILFCPWIIAAVIVVPLWTMAALPYQSPPNVCVIVVGSLAGVLCPVLVYFIPLIGLAILTFKLLLLCFQIDNLNNTTVNTVDTHSVNNNARAIAQNDTNSGVGVRTSPVKRQTTITSTSTEVAASTAPPHNRRIAALCFVNLTFTVMWFPFQCVSFLLSLCSDQMCVPATGFTQAITLIGAAASAICPLFWFVDRQLRMNMGSLCDGACKAHLWSKATDNAPPSSDVEETFV